MLYDEIIETIDKSLLFTFDWKNPETKSFLDRLTLLCHKTLNEKEVKHIDCNYIYNSIKRLSYFPHAACRVYELLNMYEINSIKNKFGTLDMYYDIESNRQKHLKLWEYDNIIYKSKCMINGVINYEKKDFQMANYFFLKGNQEAIRDSICTPFFSYSRSVIPIPDQFSCSSYDCRAEKDFMILTSANSAYVIKYTERYLKSLAGKGIDFHCIVIDDTSSQDEFEKLNIFLSRMQTNYNNFSYSIDSVPDIFDKRTYFAMNRYLKAKEFLKKRKGLVITDIDYELTGDWNILIEQFYHNDILININEDHTAKSMLPWMTITVGTVGIKNTQVGWNFLSLYSKLFYQYFAPFGFNWGIDQNIASAIYQKFRNIWSFMNIRRMKEQPFGVPYDLKRQK